LFVYGPQITVEVGDFVESAVTGLLQTTVKANYQLQSKEHVFYVSSDGKHIVEGAIYAVSENPFKKVNDTIDVTEAPSFGKEGASVRIVAYSDFQCPYCAQEATLLRGQLRREYGEKLRVYFREFPLSTHNWAKDAAVVGRCVYINEPEVFWDFHDWIFANQKSITPENLSSKATEFAAGKGVNAADLSACIEAKKTLKDVERSIAEGGLVGVTSTPTIFVNGRKLSGSHRWEQLKAIIDYEIDYQKVTQNAGDDCGCSVELQGFPN
jgi:protein-disulfide isomerase